MVVQHAGWWAEGLQPAMDRAELGPDVNRDYWRLADFVALMAALVIVVLAIAGQDPHAVSSLPLR